jgi:Rha family phage regulatory protein
MNDLILATQNGEPVASSRQIAESFDKRHDHVIRDIDNLKGDVPNFGEMFFETEIPDSYGRPQRAYLMNRDGFSLLAMGFTGKAALEWKIKYIAAFNAMEQQLSQKQPDLAELSPELRCLIRLEQQQKQQAQEIVRLNQKLDQLQGTGAFGTGGWRRESARIIARIAQVRGGAQHGPNVYQAAYTLLEEREHCSLTDRLEALRSKQRQQGMSKTRAGRLTKMDAIAASPESVERWLKILHEMEARYCTAAPEKE